MFNQLPRDQFTAEQTEQFKHQYFEDMQWTADVIYSQIDTNLPDDLYSPQSFNDLVTLINDVQNAGHTPRSDDEKKLFSAELAGRIQNCLTFRDLYNLLKQYQSNKTNPIVDPENFRPTYLTLYFFERIFGRTSIEYRTAVQYNRISIDGFMADLVDALPD